MEVTGGGRKRNGELNVIERWLVNERRGMGRGKERIEEGSPMRDLALLNQASTDSV